MPDATTEIRYPEVHVQLTGQDGNAFMIIGRIAKALRSEVSPDAAAEFSHDAMNCESYDALLDFAGSTVNVY